VAGAALAPQAAWADDDSRGVVDNNVSWSWKSPIYSVS